MTVGIGFLGMLTGTIATFFLNKNDNTTFKNQTFEYIKTRLDNFVVSETETILENKNFQFLLRPCGR
jgi:voltage-gated potassium channel